MTEPPSSPLPRFHDLPLRFARYLLTGGAVAVVDIGVFAAAHGAGASVFVAALVSFLVAVVANYLLTSWFVFGRTFELRRGLSFFAFALVGLGINVTTTTVLAAMLPIPAVIAKVCGIGVAFAFNFLINYLVVFRPR